MRVAIGPKGFYLGQISLYFGIETVISEFKYPSMKSADRIESPSVDYRHQEVVKGEVSLVPQVFNVHVRAVAIDQVDYMDSLDIAHSDYTCQYAGHCLGIIKSEVRLSFDALPR